MREGDDLETAVLEGMQHRRMDRSVLAVLCDKYTRHINMRAVTTILHANTPRGEAPGESAATSTG